MKVVAYIGEPATGKSTIMASIVARLRETEEDEPTTDGLLRFHVFRQQRTIVFGVYDGSLFSGTDRLAKAAAPKFREWIEQNSQAGEFADFTVFWEGERFTNEATLRTMFSFCQVELYQVKASAEALRLRHSTRDRQSETWLKAMKTRVEKLAETFPARVIKNG